jgi:hypothetical protein
MPNKSVDTILAEAEQLARVWADNPTFSLGELTLARLQAMIDDLRTRRDRVQQLRTELTAAVNDTGASGDALDQTNTRIRGGIRAIFGTDSNQYDQAGGTRASERKRPTRRPKPDDAA